MITLLEGTPGSGKSYYAVADYLLPWLRAGRRLYVAVDGFYLDRLALFEGRPLPDLHKQVTLWTDRSAIPSLLLSRARLRRVSRRSADDLPGEGEGPQ